ncbi:MAG: carbohydrate binding domain-containing protein [Verrucomicrobia bacterium]|nr:carbohydrate binding domain-containing protein [Verrucomicrobiota bacterium]
MKKIIALFTVALTLTATAQNLIQNAAFESGDIKPWQVQGKLPTEAVVELGVLHLVISESSDTPSHRMIVQKNLVMESSTKYTLRFEAKTDASNGGDMKVTVVPSVNFKAGHYGLMRNETITPEWETHEFEFRTKDIPADDPACMKIHLGMLNGDTYFRNFVLEKKSK